MTIWLDDDEPIAVRACDAHKGRYLERAGVLRIEPIASTALPDEHDLGGEG